jgi:hypothetical protein
MARFFSLRRFFGRTPGAAFASSCRATIRKPSRLTLEPLETRLTPATTLSIADSSALEPMPDGTVNLDFTVTRAGDLTSQVTVGYTTIPGTAQPARDFTPTTGTTTFDYGSATATIRIPVFGNSAFDNSTLTFSVQLTGIVNIVGPPATLASKTDFPATPNPAFVATGDFNVDGRPDLAIANDVAGSVSVLLNTTSPGAAAPSFAAKQDFTTEPAPLFLAVGDLNGDGRVDLAALNRNSGSVSVLLNTTPPGAAAPSFAAKQDFTTGADPESVAIGDLNGDGMPDLVLTNRASDSVSVLLNTTAPGAATATFAAKQDFATRHLPQSVAVGDLNGDGRPDLAVANSSEGTVSVLLNTMAPGAATASFAARHDFTAGGTGTFDVAIGDLNSDGKPDLAVVDNLDRVDVLLNTTVPGATAPSLAHGGGFLAGSTPNSVAIGDLNGDGKPDLATANAKDHTVTVLLNTTPPGATTPSFAQHQGFAGGMSPNSVALGDFNGDGLPDLAVTDTISASVSVLLNTTVPGVPTITPDFPQTGAPAGTNPQAMAIGDLNGDGKPDLAVVSDSTVLSVLLNATMPGAATPSFVAKKDFDTGFGPRSVAIGDLNGDGKPDLAVATTGLFGSGGVSVLLNATMPGGITPDFAAAQDFTTGRGAISVAIGDLNGDGRPDLAIANLLSNSVSVLLNTTMPGAATPSFAAKQDFTTGTLPKSVAISDVNGDGLPDLAVANRQSASVSVLLNTTAPGATTPAFAAKQDFTTGNNAYSVATGDLNGDGKPDLAVASRDSNSVSVLLNTTAPGATTPAFAAKQDFPTVEGPTWVAIRDLNGDGKPDLAIANFTNGSVSSNSVSVLRNTTAPGATTPAFAAKQDFTTGVLDMSVAVGDLNGDGRPDLATSNDGGDSVSVLPNTPVTISRSTATGTIIESDLRTGQSTVQFETATQTVDENARTFSLTVTRSTTSDSPTTIPFTLGGTAVNSTDYSGVTASPLVIPAGQTSGTITGTLLDDGKFNTNNHTLIVTLGTPTNATLGTTTSDTLTIQESDPQPTVQFATATQSINENAGSFTIALTLSAASAVDTTVPFTLGGTAVNGTDYRNVTASSLVIPAGQTGATITGTLIDDGAPDVTKTLVVTLDTPLNATLGTITSDTLTIGENAPQPTMLSATAAPATSVFGQAVTFTATVTSSAGTPTGDVAFMEGTVTLGTGTLDADGRAGFTTSTLAVGNHTITAAYGGDGRFAASTAPAFSAAVNAAPTTTTVASSGSPSVVGQAVTFTATVGSGASVPARGVVTFTIDGTAQPPVALDGGQAQFATSTLAVGTHAVTAAYSGDSNFSGSSGSLTVDQTVNPAAPTGTEGPLVGAGTPVNGFERTPLTDVTVATLTQAGDREPASDFTATIDWGDGTSSAGTVAATDDGFAVRGSHLYTDEGTFSILVTVGKVNASITLPTQATILEELLPDGTRGTANQRFITEVYRDLLHRQTDAGGLAFWSGLLDQGISRRQVVFAIESCPTLEYRHIQVEDMYRALLQRPADPQGMSSGVAFLQAGGSVEQLAVLIIGSPEYAQKSGPTNVEFLKALYQDALHRAMDVGGQAFWDQALAGGTSRAAVAAAFFASDEYRTDLVQSYYHQFLDRTAEPAGLNTWFTHLRNGDSDERVLADIVGEPSRVEFFEKIAS